MRLPRDRAGLTHPGMTSNIRAVNPTGPVPQTCPDRRAVALPPLHLAVTALVLAWTFAALWLRLHEDPASYEAIAIVSGLTGLGLVAYARWGLRLSWMSAPLVYLMLLWVFHFGMTFTTTAVPSTLD